MKKEHRAEIKTWRKDLGDANSKIIKLEKKLKEQNSKNPMKKIANMEPYKINKSKKLFPKEAKPQSFATFPSSAQSSSLVTPWIPISAKTPQRPGLISSMITHCALLPPPGSSFISMEEVLELMKEFLKKPLFRFDAT